MADQEGGDPRKRIDSVPLDLVAIALAVAATGFAAWLGLDWVQAVGGLAVGLFAPGHLLLSALFPERPGPEGSRRTLTGVERVGLALALSLLTLGFVGLLLISSPQGLTLGTAYAVVGSILGFFGLAAVARWYQVPRHRRYALVLPGGPASSAAETALLVAAVVTTVAAVGAAGVAFLGEPRESFTEFFVEGPDGRSMCYPASYNGSAYFPSPADRSRGCMAPVDHVIVGVANRESESRAYWIRVLWTWENRTTGAVEVRQVEEIEVRVEPLPIDVDPDHVDNATRLEYQLPRPAVAGPQKIVFQLYRQDPLSADSLGSPYRSLELAIESVAP